MTLKTSGGEEISVTMITINEKPMSVTFRMENITVREAIAMLSNDNTLPIQEYSEFSEIECIRKHGRNSVMVTLCKPEIEGQMPTGIHE